MYNNIKINKNGKNKIFTIKSNLQTHQKTCSVIEVVISHKDEILNLNNIIDYNFYPVEETIKSNMKHRPIGIGIQGLGDLYNILEITYSSYVAKYLDALIMETIYYYAIDKSSDIAYKTKSYSTYINSKFYNSIFQCDLWKDNNYYMQRLNWDKLKIKVKKYGMANSLLTALMPTASTSRSALATLSTICTIGTFNLTISSYQKCAVLQGITIRSHLAAFNICIPSSRKGKGRSS